MKTCNLLFIVSTAALAAQDDFTLDWSSISAGGLIETAGPGEFTIEGTIGQLAADEPASGPTGEFSISGGYWAFTLNEPVDLGMTVHLGGGVVTLTWDDSTGIPVVLESSGDLQLWEPVNPQPPHPPFIEPAGQRRYYRLMPSP
jgi:hypothetical protein